MARANIVGLKTMTRRIIKPQPGEDGHGNFFHGNGKGFVKIDGHPNWRNKFISEFCKYKIGDLLWQRESGWVDNNFIRGLNDPNLYWKADFELYNEVTKVIIKEHCCFFPSMFMYKEFSRLKLIITNIRIEQVQEITNDDAIAEGIGFAASDSHYAYFGYRNYLYNSKSPDHNTIGYGSPKRSYQSLWQLINGLKSWNDNPWVWVIEYKIVG